MVEILTASCEVMCAGPDSKVRGNDAPLLLSRAGFHLAGSHVISFKTEWHAAALRFRGVIADKLVRVYRQYRQYQDSSSIVLGLLEDIVLCRARC